MTYETDFYAWANAQAALLRAGQFGEADVANIAEELESMGRSEKRQLVHRLTVLLTHLLKWQYQPERRGASWQATIRIQRIAITKLVADNPSLKSRMCEAIGDAYVEAVITAALETGLAEATFPATCLWPTEAIMDEAFWP